MTQSQLSPYREQEARSYDHDRAREPHWQREHEYVRELLTRRAPSRMLDAPIGTGRFLELKTPARRLMGLDLSPAMLHVSKTRAEQLQLEGLALVRGSISALPFPARSFDLTLCCRFMHLIPGDALDTMFAELSRVTAGRVCVQAYVRGPLAWRLASRARRVSRRLLEGRANQGDPWSHISAYFHAEGQLLDAAASAKLRLASRTEIDRYNASRVVMYEWDSG